MDLRSRMSSKYHPYIEMRIEERGGILVLIMKSNRSFHDLFKNSHWIPSLHRNDRRVPFSLKTGDEPRRKLVTKGWFLARWRSLMRRWWQTCEWVRISILVLNLVKNRLNSVSSCSACLCKRRTLHPPPNWKISYDFSWMGFIHLYYSTNCRSSEMSRFRAFGKWMHWRRYLIAIGTDKGHIS